MAENELAVSERKRLAELETTIEQGLETFMQVGLALQEIHSTKLYRETHTTFAAYCEQRWSFSDRRARQLMAAAQIGTSVPVPSERHARALAPLIADRGLEAAGEFLRSQPETATAAELEAAVKQELHPVHPQIQADAEEFGRLVREMDSVELAQYLLKLNPDQKFPNAVAAVMKLEQFQREAARSLVAAVQEMIAESEQKQISLEEVVAELDDMTPAFLTDNGFALVNYAAMRAFAEGSGENEIDRVTQLSWDLADNGVRVEFQPRHFVRWAEAELELRAA